MVIITEDQKGLDYRWMMMMIMTGRTRRRKTTGRRRRRKKREVVRLCQYGCLRVRSCRTAGVTMMTLAHAV